MAHRSGVYRVTQIIRDVSVYSPRQTFGPFRKLVRRQ